MWAYFTYEKMRPEALGRGALSLGSCPSLVLPPVGPAGTAYTTLSLDFSFLVWDGRRRVVYIDFQTWI